MGKISRILAAGLCLLWMGAAMTTSTTKTRTYAADDSAFPNAQIGYAPMIDTAEAGDAALRYLELTWREAEPEEGVYAWEAISEKYDFASLREQGIHLVLRFVCDVPGQETHLDIPDWLYAQTKDGSWYDTDYGKGYSPNYANVVFRAAHHRVLYALSSGTSHSAQFAMAAMLKAANEADNNSLSPIYLLQAGEILVKQGKYDDAIQAYTTIKDKYFRSYQAMDIDKYIEQAKLLKK